MSTKKQIFRRESERTRPPRPKKPRRARRDAPVDTARPGVSATDRKAGDGHTAERNRRASGEHTVALEDSSTDRPSRKSTRRSAQRKKAASVLERHNRLKPNRPVAKATHKKRPRSHARAR